MTPEQYVQNINFATLSGGTYQAQYNDWQIDNLVVVVDEAQLFAPAMAGEAS